MEKTNEQSLREEQDTEENYYIQQLTESRWEDEIKDEMIRHQNEIKGSWHLKKETDATNNTTVALINI